MHPKPLIFFNRLVTWFQTYSTWAICITMMGGCVDFRLSGEEMQKEFEAMDIKPVSERISVDSNHIHYVYVDQGRPNLVVFIHGSPGSWSAFLNFFRTDSLLESFDMLSIDRPGFGDSDYGRPIASMEEQAFLMQEVIKKFSHQHIIVVGHSLGGPVASRLAMDFPDLIQGLVLVAPSIDPDQEKYEWYRSWVKTRIGGALTPTDFWVSNEEIMPLKTELTKMLSCWEKIKIPVIVIQGTKDVLVPKENAEFARRMLPDTLLDIRYLEGVNHFIPWSHPEQIVFGLRDLAISSD